MSSVFVVLHPLRVLGYSFLLIAAYCATVAIGLMMSTRRRERAATDAWLEKASNDAMQARADELARLQTRSAVAGR
jgi:hypothetical protein